VLYAISDYLLDIAHNAVQAGAGLVELTIRDDARQFEVKISDTGCGMDSAQIDRAKDPFANDRSKHPERSVGLGIPFLIQVLEQTGGRWQIDSRKGIGTTVDFAFMRDHIDTPPEGNLIDAIAQALSFDGDFEMVVHRVRGRRELQSAHEPDECEYTVRRSELVCALGELRSAGSRALLRRYIASQEESLVDCEEDEKWQR